MTNNQYRIEFTSDLSRGITVTPIRFALLSNENMAHAFVIKTTRNGQKNDLTGSNVRAYFIPASQNLSVLIDGEVDQNGNAVIELTKDCYYYTGRFFLIIETEMDNVTSCIFYGDGYVTKTNTDEIVAPPETVGIISAVLYNKPQSLTDAQKAQARANIGAISEVDVPKKGVDYWTEADQESIVQQVIAALGTPVFGTVDANNNIILSGELTDGFYAVKYEDSDGNVIAIGNLGISSAPAYTNLLSTAIGQDGAVLNGVGYVDGYRLSGDCNAAGQLSYHSAASGYFLTGYMPITKEQIETGCTIYVKGVNLTANDGNVRMLVAPDYNYTGYINNVKIVNDSIPGVTFTQIADQYYKFSLSYDFLRNGNYPHATTGAAFSDVKYFRMSLSGSGEGVIITLNQEITDNAEPDNPIVNLIDTVGYQDGKRVNSNGEYIDADGYTSSGRISVTQGDVLRTKGINFDAADNGRCNIHVWEASGANQYFILNSTSDLPKDTNHLNITIDDNNNLTVTIKSTAFVEITFTGYGSGADLIVTKNQEIT